jgi:hypothetical protein
MRRILMGLGLIELPLFGDGLKKAVGDAMVFGRKLLS